MAELVERIDWTPFFQTWELAGHYPAILDDPQARNLPEITLGYTFYEIDLPEPDPPATN